MTQYTAYKALSIVFGIKEESIRNSVVKAGEVEIIELIVRAGIVVEEVDERSWF